MDARVRIAAAIWFVTMLLGIPAAFVMFFMVVSTVNLSGHGSVSTTPIFFVALVPAIVAALATKLTTPYAARASQQQVHAGPVVLTCCAGFVLGAWLGSGGGAALALMAMAALSFAGAVSGTWIQAPLRPLAVGVAMAVFTELTVLFTS